jgi:hypothetical protein
VAKWAALASLAVVSICAAIPVSAAVPITPTVVITLASVRVVARPVVVTIPVVPVPVIPVPVVPVLIVAVPVVAVPVVTVPIGTSTTLTLVTIRDTAATDTSDATARAGRRIGLEFEELLADTLPCHNDLQACIETTKNYVTANPDVTGIFAIDATALPAAGAALEEIGNRTGHYKVHDYIHDQVKELAQQQKILNGKKRMGAQILVLENLFRI